jgi:hypothetical protein
MNKPEITEEIMNRLAHFNRIAFKNDFISFIHKFLKEEKGWDDRKALIRAGHMWAEYSAEYFTENEIWHPYNVGNNITAIWQTHIGDADCKASILALVNTL